MSVIDLAGIKTQIKSLLDTANTTTASTFLSNNMTDKIQKVMTINPAKVPPQASFYPFVTTWVDSKDIDTETMTLNVSKGRKIAQINISVLGAIFHSPITSDLDDPTELDVNFLMENVEQILRDSTTLNSTCKWHLAESVEYFDIFNGDKPFLRAGQLKITANVQY